MSVRRVMGTEVEYGISVPGQPTANPTILSSQIVNAWAVADAPTRRRPRWDFEEESPLRDARGFDLTPAQALDHNVLHPAAHGPRHPSADEAHLDGPGCLATDATNRFRTTRVGCRRGPAERCSRRSEAVRPV